MDGSAEPQSFTAHFESLKPPGADPRHTFLLSSDRRSICLAAPQVSIYPTFSLFYTLKCTV